MTRIGVISDTHGSRAAIDACIGAAGVVDGWFHLGDYASDAKYLAERTGKPVYTVFGNCDGASFSGVAEHVFPNRQGAITAEAVVTVEKARIFLCHGHTYDVDLAPYTLSYRAEELGAAAALYGHTHRGGLSAFGALLVLNPGSPSRPRGAARRSFAVLEIDGADVNASIKTI
ncbi:MAG: YfcE family phosphodiesterase [Clostridia bacterium]|nr:YfcE family phosphodiesterase [Clostridia bacterium]